MQIIDLTGRTFNFLTVEKFYKKTSKNSSGKCNYFWKCRCICGNEKITSSTNLKTGDTKSCGCKRTAHNVLKEGDATFNEIFSNYRRRALKKNIEFALTKEQFKNLVLDKCHYCKIPPFSQQRSPSKNGAFNYNGIDRKDNSLGYTLLNSVTCCEFCNRAKFQHDISTFKKWMEYVKNS